VEKRLTPWLTNPRKAPCTKGCGCWCFQPGCSRIRAGLKCVGAAVWEAFRQAFQAPSLVQRGFCELCWLLFLYITDSTIKALGKRHIFYKAAFLLTDICKRLMVCYISSNQNAFVCNKITPRLYIEKNQSQRRLYLQNGRTYRFHQFSFKNFILPLYTARFAWRLHRFVKYCASSSIQLLLS